jgi:RimK family alpha-L-glutamate ligase
MQIAYLHRITFDESEQRFSEEAKVLGIDLVLIKYRQLRLENGRIMFGDMDMKDFDGWYFRSVGSELEWSKLLQLYAKKHNVPVVDEYLLTQGPLRRFKSVMTWQLLEAGIAYPKSSYIETWSDLENFLKESKFPLIVKLSQGGRHGMGTFWIREYDDLNKLKDVLEKRKMPVARGFLVQEYIENDGDYRVMTVGYKCIGGFKRQVKEEKLILNKSMGRSVGLAEVPENVAKVAEAAAKILEVEVAGTDLVVSKKTGEVYIIEVNEAPQFKVFEKRTKVNAPRKILEYCISKFEK